MPIYSSTTTGTTDWYQPADTWQTWVGTGTTSSSNVTISATGGTSIWGTWQGTFTRTYTLASTNGALWNDWVVSGVPANAVQVYSMQDLNRESRRPQRTEDEWARIRAENEQLRVERDAVQAAARAEAHKLLALVLTKEQMASYETRRYFDVAGSEGGLFRIHHGTSGNIRQLIDGREVNRLCVHPQLWDRDPVGNGAGYLPTEDCLAAQALALMHDELGAVTTANVHQGQRHLRAA